MVVKEFLENSGIDLTKYQHYHNTKQVVRRQLHRTFGGEITIPVPRPTEEVKKALKAKIQNGDYCLGEAIVPRKYKKVTINPKGEMVEEEFTVSG